MGSNVNLSNAAVTNAWNALEALRKDLALARRRGCDALVAILEDRLAFGEKEFALAEKRRDLLASAEAAEREAKLALDAAIERQHDLEIGPELTAKDRAEILRRRDDVDVSRALFLVRGRQREEALAAATNPLARVVVLAPGKNPHRERAERTVRGLVHYSLDPWGSLNELSPARDPEEAAWEEFFAREELETYSARAEERRRSLFRGGLRGAHAEPKPAEWVRAELAARGVVLAP